MMRERWGGGGVEGGAAVVKLVPNPSYPTALDRNHKPAVLNPKPKNPKCLPRPLLNPRPRTPPDPSPPRRPFSDLNPRPSTLSDPN